MMKDQATTEADRSLNSRIRESLRSDATLADATQNIHLSSNNGVVTLHGTVPTEKEKSDIEARVEKMANVKEVQNQLQIAPRTSSTATPSSSSAR